MGDDETQQRMFKRPLLTMESALGETIKFFIFTPQDALAREMSLWITVERDGEEQVRFLDIRMTEEDLRTLVQLSVARLFEWDEILKPRLVRDGD